jgi:cytochrome c
LLGPRRRRSAPSRSPPPPGFSYSPAAQSGIVWSAETLDGYLAAPTQRVPGTQMSVGVPSGKNRTDLIACLLSIGH